MRPRLARRVAMACVGPALTVGAMVLTGGAVLAAQEASPYVPLQHWAMPYVEHLIATGVIADPTPLTRPLKQSDLARALQAADTTRLSPAARATVRRLLTDLAGHRAAPAFRIEGTLGAAAATQALRDPLELGRGIPPRPLDKRAFVSAGAEVQMRFGPVVGVTHPKVDTRLQYDPDWYAVANNSTRFEEGYVSAQWRHAE